MLHCKIEENVISCYEDNVDPLQELKKAELDGWKRWPDNKLPDYWGLSFNHFSIMGCLLYKPIDMPPLKKIIHRILFWKKCISNRIYEWRFCLTTSMQSDAVTPAKF